MSYRTCTCLGSCKGADGLADGWKCARATPPAAPAITGYPTLQEECPARNDGPLHNANEGHAILMADALAMVDVATAALRARVTELTRRTASLDEQLIGASIAPPSEPVAWCPRDKNAHLYVEHSCAHPDLCADEVATLNRIESEFAPYAVVPLYTRPAAPSEPVAWMRDDGGTVTNHAKRTMPNHTVGFTIPLYTRPAPRAERTYTVQEFQAGVLAALADNDESWAARLISAQSTDAGPAPREVTPEMLDAASHAYNQSLAADFDAGNVIRDRDKYLRAALIAALAESP